MEYVNLGKIAKIKTGKLDANAANKNGKYPFFTCSKEPLTINTYSYDCECVLVAGNGDLNVKYYNGKFDAYQRTYIIEILDKNKYNTKYIYLLLISYINALRSKAVGGVIKYIKLGNLTSLKVPMIDIIEQEKIVKNLFKLDKVINIKVLQLKTCDNLIKSQFVEMFGDPVLNDFKWEQEYLAKLGTFKNGIFKWEQEYLAKLGTFKNGINFDKTSNGEEIFFLGVGNFKNGKTLSKKEQLDTILLNDKIKDEYLLKKDDIIFVRSNGSKELVGRTILIKNIDFDLTYSGFCIRFRNENKNINPIFLIELFNNDRFFRNLKRGNRGANINNINQQTLSKLDIIIPPIELQDKFAEIVKQIDKQKFVKIV